MHYHVMGLLREHLGLQECDCCYSAFLCCLAIEFSMMLRGEHAGHERVTRPVFLTNGRHLFNDVFVFYFQHENTLNVTFNRNGIARWMGWIWPVADIALFGSKRRAIFALSIRTYLRDPMQVHVPFLLFNLRCMVCAERKPQDPWFPRLKLVGVYPVQCSWAYINLEDVAGKGQEYDSPLYIVPGGAAYDDGTTPQALQL